MEARFRLTERDQLAAWLRLRWPATVGGLVGVWVGCFALIPALAAAQWSTGSPIELGTASLAALGVAVVGSPLPWLRHRGRIARELRRHRRAHGSRTRTVCLDDAGVSVASVQGAARVPWSAVEQVRFSGRWLFVHQRGLRTEVIPRSAVEDETTLRAALGEWRRTADAPPTLPQPEGERVVRYELTARDWALAFSDPDAADEADLQIGGLVIVGGLTLLILLAFGMQETPEIGWVGATILAIYVVARGLRPATVHGWVQRAVARGELVTGEVAVALDDDGVTLHHLGWRRVAWHRVTVRRTGAATVFWLGSAPLAPVPDRALADGRGEAWSERCAQLAREAVTPAPDAQAPAVTLTDNPWAAPADGS